jgi:hypothetical protein
MSNCSRRGRAHQRVPAPGPESRRGFSRIFGRTGTIGTGKIVRNGPRATRGRVGNASVAGHCRAPHRSDIVKRPWIPS